MNIVQQLRVGGDHELVDIYAEVPWIELVPGPTVCVKTIVADLDGMASDRRRGYFPAAMWSLLLVGVLRAAPETESGRLEPCPTSPNCVSSLAGRPGQTMPPLTYDLPEAEVVEALEEALASSARAEVVVREPFYLRSRFVSRVFHFVDDVEFLIDPDAHLIHFRSASRTGYYDFGVNRRRMEALARRLTSLPGIRMVDSSP
jgi:uncharacterized protein (DUF1499 family)